MHTSHPADFALSGEDSDPHHEFEDVFEQLIGNGATYDPDQPYPTPNNSGFVANYLNSSAGTPAKCMHGYEEQQLPIISTLAREFAICDHWFSSMPGPTWPNRLFVHAGSSAGLDNSPGNWDVVTTTLIDGYRFYNGTIFDRLEDKCIDWQVFEGDETPKCSRSPA